MAHTPYLTCTCGHKDWMHSATKPHPCRSRECNCEAMMTQNERDRLLESIEQAKSGQLQPRPESSR